MEKGDVVMGVVSAVQEAGLLVTLFCLDGGKVRDIDELNITVSEALVLLGTTECMLGCCPDCKLSTIKLMECSNTVLLIFIN